MNLTPPYIECGRVELMPVHRCGHDGLTRPTGYRDIMNGRDYFRQFVPGQRRQQAQCRLTRLCCNLDQVMIDRFFVSAPVEPTPDPLNYACRLQTLKPAP